MAGNRSIDRHAESLSAGAIQLGKWGRGMLGPIGRIFGREHVGIDTRTLALISRTLASETLCLSTRKFSKMASADKLHLDATHTEPGRKLFQTSRDYVKAQEAWLIID